MSPTEDELRAALRDGEGEGDGPDAGRIIGRAQRLRAQRRSRLLNTAATVAIVAAIGGGGTWLLHGTSSDEKAGSNSTAGGAAAGAASVPRAQERVAGPASGPSSSLDGGSGSKAEAFTCAESPPRVLMPESSDAAGGPLFTSAVTKLVVCAYSDLSRRPAALVFTGAQAQTIVASLESSPSAPPSGMCPAYRIAGERTAQLTGITADGKVAGRVTATLDRPTCATTATNGRTVRYGWRPPALLLTAISRHLPLGGAAPPTK